MFMRTLCGSFAHLSIRVSVFLILLDTFLNINIRQNTTFVVSTFANSLLDFLLLVVEISHFLTLELSSTFVISSIVLIY